MKVLFHTNQLDIRGTTVAITDYARYNQELLGNESIICYDSSTRDNGYQGEDPRVKDRLSKQFKIVDHRSIAELERVIDSEQIDFAYFIRSGFKDFLPSNCKTGVHAVFQNFDPHGDRYAYVSEWLSDSVTTQYQVTPQPWVPHVVQLPEPNIDYRQYLGIKPEQLVIGRHGGKFTFDLPFVKDAIIRLVNARNDIVFVFVGTEPWTSHPNIRFLNDVQHPQLKANLINTWDAMIHARHDGESFGLAICEALYLNKPVFAWELGVDRNHTQILENSGTLYNEGNIFEMLINARDFIGKETWKNRVEKFNPCATLNKFKEVFLT